MQKSILLKTTFLHFGTTQFSCKKIASNQLEVLLPKTFDEEAISSSLPVT